MFNNKLIIFNKFTISIFSNFIPNKLVTFNDKDPPWMTEKSKEQIKWKHKVYRDYLKMLNRCRLYEYTSYYNQSFPT